MRTAIVGAGVAGAVCACELSRTGLGVCVFDGGRRVGGRSSTRTVQPSAEFPSGLAFDHGVPAFADGDLMRLFRSENLVQAWPARVRQLGPVSAHGDRDSREDLWVGVPSMDGMVAGILSRCPAVTVKSGTKVASATRNEGGWALHAEDGGLLGENYQALVIATHPFAAEQLDVGGHLSELAGSVTGEPQWALMAAVDGDEPIDWDIGVVRDRSAPDVARVVVDSNKPQRARSPVRVVAYSTPEFAAQNLQTPRDEVANALTPQVEALISRELNFAQAHRWSKARSLTPALASQSFYFDDSRALGAAGDYFGHRPGTLQAAYDSGAQLADRIFKSSANARL